MRKTTRNLLIGILVGVGIAGITSGGIYYYFGIVKMTALQTHYEQLLAKQSESLSPVYQLKSDIHRNEIVSAAQLDVVELPGHLMHESLVIDAGDLDVLKAARDLPAGALLTRDMLYDEKAMPADLRVIEMTQIILPTLLEQDGAIDVRISFPSGLDYVVLSKKSVMGLSRPTAENPTGALPILELHVNAQELLRLSSALVDAFVNEGTYLYATVYVAPDLQAAAQVTYPSNDDVQKLMLEDPNIVEKAMVELEQQRRQALAASLLKVPEARVRALPVTQSPSENMGASATTASTTTASTSTEEGAPSLSDLD